MAEPEPEIDALSDLEAYSDRLRAAGMNDGDVGAALKDATLAIALRDEVHRIEEELRVASGANGEEATMSADDFYERLNRVAEEHGIYGGLPIPLVEDTDAAIITGRRTPLWSIHGAHAMVQQERRETALDRDLINQWHRLGDCTVKVVRTTEGPMSLQLWDAGTRLRAWMDTCLTRVRSPATAVAERRAQRSLRRRLSKAQWESYVLNDCFLERSSRSDLHYMFRKGRPTLAISTHGDYTNSSKVLAALCLHPMGYYEGTFCGVMTPSDEVLAVLLLMRVDERKLWAKSGQWAASDWRSGL